MLSNAVRNLTCPQGRIALTRRNGAKPLQRRDYSLERLGMLQENESAHSRSKLRLIYELVSPYAGRQRGLFSTLGILDD